MLGKERRRTVKLKIRNTEDRSKLSHQHKRDCFIYKIFYVRLIVTTKQKSTVDSQKMKRREPKHTIMENHQFTKGGSKRGKKEQGKYKSASDN